MTETIIQMINKGLKSLKNMRNKFIKAIETETDTDTIQEYKEIIKAYDKEIKAIIQFKNAIKNKDTKTIKKFIKELN